MFSPENRSNSLAVSLFLVGLALRIIFFQADGTADFPEYVKWGKNTYEKGLVQAFEGAYFPVQYQSFQLAYGLSLAMDIPADKAIRVFNLVAEIGCFFILLRLLRGRVGPLAVVMLFWLNPLSLVIFEQGYVDAQMAFFVLLSLLIIESTISPKQKYLLAGLPLGIALLMKPQIIPVFAALFVLLFYTLIKMDRTAFLKASAMFVLPAVLYIAYSAYIGLNLDIYDNHKTLPVIAQSLEERIGLPRNLAEIGAGSVFLTAQYAYVPKRMPAINAFMANPWYFVAEMLRAENQSLFRVSDTNRFLGLTYRLWGELLVALTFIATGFRIWRSSQTFDRRLIYMMGLATILVPYLATSAHENHFYLGFLFLVIIGSLLKDRCLLWSSIILGGLNALNILLLYVLPQYTSYAYGQPEKFLIIGASSAAFIVLLYYLIQSHAFRIKLNA